MEIEFSSLNLEQLTKLHQRANAELKQALLDGTSWSDVKAKREIVTQLSIQIHKRKVHLGLNNTPADTAFRED